MIVIHKDDVEYFRYSVAKIIFTREYWNEYKSIEDCPKSNFLKANYNNKPVLISLFGKLSGDTDKISTKKYDEFHYFYEKKLTRMISKTYRLNSPIAL